MAHGSLVAAGFVLLAIQATKLIGVLSAIRWIVFHGSDYIGRLKAREDHFTEQIYWKVLDQTNGKMVPPFGVMDYRVFRLASRSRPLVGRVLRLARALLYDFTSIGIASVVFLYLASAPMLSGIAGGIVPALATASAALVVAQLVAIYAEACVSYARLGSYGLAFHKASRYLETRRAGPYFTEIKILAGAIIYSLGTGAFTLYFTSFHGGRFTSLSVSGTTLKATGGDLLNCIYFSLTTFFTVETPGPITGPARAATASLVGQAVCALILTLSTFALFTAPQGEPPSTANVAPHVEPTVQRDIAPPHHPTSSLVQRRPLRSAGLFVGGLLIGAVITNAACRRHRPTRRSQ